MWFLPAVLLVASVPLLGRSADRFVTATSQVALRYRVPPVLVGAIIVGFGTSLPEALASVLAALDGSLDVAVGNVVGSNVANLTLVLGPAALLCTLTFPPPILRREIVLMLVSSFLLAGLLVDGHLSRFDAAVLLVGLVLTVGVVVRPSSAGGPELAREVIEFGENADAAGLVWSRLVLGLSGTVGGAYLLVWSATVLADRFGLTGGLVGVSIVAIGTSLPEMVTSYHAARRAEGELIVGNLLGSNILNALFVAGTAALVGPGTVSSQLAGSTTWTMVAVSVLVGGLALTFRRVPHVAVPFLITGYAAVLVSIA